MLIEQKTLETINHKLKAITIESYLAQNHSRLFELFYLTGKKLRSINQNDLPPLGHH